MYVKDCCASIRKAATIEVGNASKHGSLKSFISNALLCLSHLETSLMYVSTTLKISSMYAVHTLHGKSINTLHSEIWIP
ncbi:hypothetical protein TNCT_511161 [Trichonephila clavata]|uniref:Uncharacterized protein n=1 Tax=Trichonephila clavata TaxID=2740835 RepID=A0A8X6J9D2_TRICU|nr:hypothetical protein TNCT_511161 [Trichonephila clavata]